MRWGGTALSRVLLLLFLFGSGLAIEDAADDLTTADDVQSFIISNNSQEAASLVGLDDKRFARDEPGTASLQYDEPSGIQKVLVEFYVYNSSFTARSRLQISYGGSDDTLLDTVQLGASINAQASEQELATEFAPFAVSPTASDGWYSGTVEVDTSSGDASGNCIASVTISVLGTSETFWDVQIGKVTIDALEEDGTCTLADADGCPAPTTGTCTQPSAVDINNPVRFWYDDSSSTDSLYQHRNIRLATETPTDFFDVDDGRFARGVLTESGDLTYHFEEGGINDVVVGLAISPLGQINDATNLTVRPFASQACKREAFPTPWEKLNFTQMSTNWQFAEVVYTVGLLPDLACANTSYVDISFFAPDGADLQIMYVRLIGNGKPVDGKLEETANASEQPNSSSGFLDNMQFVWIAVGLGTLLVVCLLALLWCCCGKPCCWSSPAAGRPAPIKDPHGKPGMMHNPDGMGMRHMNNGHVMIAVDAVYPPEMGHDDMHHGIPPHKYHVPNGYHHNAYTHGGHVAPHSVGRKGSRGSPNEPVVDLSIPINHAQPYMAPAPHHPHPEAMYSPNAGLSAPRQGQDIFDTWQHAGLGYHSGDDMEASGPLDTQAPSFHANPPMSSTGNTSPKQESSVIGVTAQLGMRFNELKGLQHEHEKVAKGQYDSNGDMAVAPEPLGVTYGKKIGVGGFGAVYEGQWAGKHVAIKVIKMPQTSKPGEDKAKMAFMEYAISGILLHDNIVQTYQADIRPVFLEDDATTPVSRSGWTGIGEFLSNEAISQQLQKSMRIQEWELRLVMEHCNRGNLKEAIRNGTLQHSGAPRAMEVALLALDVARGCQSIHKYNIIHGDLKPHNVLLTSNGNDERGWCGKIADFGLSVKIKRGEEHVSGIQHGTEGYVAPEVLQTRRMVKASDVYSFGIIMWELWHSRLYYEEHRNAVKRMRRPNLEFRPTFERRCPEEWINLAKLCWSLKPEERPDFDRVVKMMTMIIASLREKVNEDGVLVQFDLL